MIIKLFQVVVILNFYKNVNLALFSFKSDPTQWLVGQSSHHSSKTSSLKNDRFDWKILRTTKFSFEFNNSFFCRFWIYWNQKSVTITIGQFPDGCARNSNSNQIKNFKASSVSRSLGNFKIKKIYKIKILNIFYKKHIYLRNVQKYGEPLPQCIQYALQYLRRTSMKQQGLFRKSGVKTRIAKLRDFCETNPEGADFCEYRENSPYDVADLVKM